VLSSTAVAVIVTVSAVAGAVKIVVMVLPVKVALKFAALQGVAPVVVHVQFTPPFPVSPVTVAATVAVVPTAMLAGGGVDNVTEIPEPTDTTVLADALVSATEVAVIVTLSAVAGAVKVVLAPLAVCAALKFAALHAVAPAVLQLHVTPMFEVSFVTVAV
jgi:hypothetical protein